MGQNLRPSTLRHALRNGSGKKIRSLSEVEARIFLTGGSTNFCALRLRSGSKNSTLRLRSGYTLRLRAGQEKIRSLSEAEARFFLTSLRQRTLLLLHFKTSLPYHQNQSKFQTLLKSVTLSLFLISLGRKTNIL